MGKYMKKSKITGEIAVMEVSISPQSSLGVRTRAKTLALQKLHHQQQQSPDSDSSSLYYLQLRSRRLEKPPLRSDANKQAQAQGPRDCYAGGGAVNSRLSVGSSADLGWDERNEKDGEGCFGNVESEAEYANDVEASFGENNLDFDGRDRSTRESTPCSLIRNSDSVGTPGSTTRRSSSIANNQRVRNDTQRTIPTALDMDEFFAQAEQQQQKLFMEKYNFDITSDMPLPGRYEWEQVIP
ncbi:putative cyclin-dependent kinase inhibitor [Rosa chinensis]|uniref:Putative cyclin-dependent kinase inhibitor n=1 Tax=Rosa chinensis TaxID=74649 RepID=A0A2P6PUF1_ROSCH|nr:cyclin-dependent kinase inhibitor 3 [Rosa chinensis]PRQ25552.1 putative cyclin-dependent kinase inhibitor [Rosa chinensis]